MSTTMEWLQEANRIYPPDEDRHHSFTLIDGILRLYLAVSGSFVPIVFDEEDHIEDDAATVLMKYQDEIGKMGAS